MATVNLGSIKFNWKGAYSGSTAYAVDDVVSYQGTSYVCILASTGNLPTNTTYWNVMAEGGDVATTLTTQGDILYRDASGLQRLGAGTSGDFLKTQGTGANPVWGSAGGGLQSIQSFTSSGTYTKPAGINKIKVIVTGAGGGGGNAGSPSNGGGGGGCSGGTAIEIIDVSSISTVSVTIGAGGAGGTSNKGGDGGTSSFGSHCSATGGQGGNKGGAIGDQRAAGVGSGGNVNLNGTAGVDGHDNNTFADRGISGAPSFWGGGGFGGHQRVGDAGHKGGGGGGGGHHGGTQKDGGAGGAGFVYVEEYK
jgi:hypothetical protein